MLPVKRRDILHGDLRVPDNVDIFKSKLKTHLFGLAYHYFL
jgi:hypothetical protein